MRTVGIFEMFNHITCSITKKSKDMSGLRFFVSKWQKIYNNFFCSKLFAIRLCYYVFELQKSKISPNFITWKKRDIWKQKKTKNSSLLHILFIYLSKCVLYISSILGQNGINLIFHHPHKSTKNENFQNSRINFLKHLKMKPHVQL